MASKTLGGNSHPKTAAVAALAPPTRNLSASPGLGFLGGSQESLGEFPDPEATPKVW